MNLQPTVEGGHDMAKLLQHPVLSPDQKWDAVFLKFLWVLRSYQKLLRLRKQKLVPCLGHGVLTVHFKELFW